MSPVRDRLSDAGFDLYRHPASDRSIAAGDARRLRRRAGGVTPLDRGSIKLPISARGVTIRIRPRVDLRQQVPDMQYPTGERVGIRARTISPADAVSAAGGDAVPPSRPPFFSLAPPAAGQPRPRPTRTATL